MNESERDKGGERGGERQTDGHRQREETDRQTSRI